ncbi:MAG: hypothetical protein GF332_01780 [Candidatus Moranbacteria bacterium]|nr:hypothetical protein [Candidatus Moranbacteria bacterium]
MINLLANLIKDHQTYEGKNNQVFDASRLILKNSKKAISLTHNQKPRQARKRLRENQELLNKIINITQENPRLRYEGFCNEALEEYVEAELYCNYIENGELEIPRKLLDFLRGNPEILIGGLADLTGELNRRAVRLASLKKLDQLQDFHEISEQIINALLELNLRGSDRHKFDQAKHNLKNLEKMLYELRLRQTDREIAGLK